jgi:hypothetical protein
VMATPVPGLLANGARAGSVATMMMPVSWRVSVDAVFSLRGAPSLPN